MKDDAEAEGNGTEARESLRELAAVDEVLREPAVQALLETYPRALVVDAARAVLGRLRREILDEGRRVAPGDVTPARLAPWIEALLSRATRPSLRRVLNATGVVVHTNLGRAVLPDEAVAAVTAAASGYSDLEYSLPRGERASRQDHVHDVLCTLTGAEDALVVNNNAAAVLLALAATARGGEVLVARGQLVEIGDGFRIPDILRESGAELVEVGTTNRTYVRDFEAAWTGRSRAVLRVHTSNYRIVGFTAEPSVGELARLAHEREAVLIDDLGSGALAELDLFADEPSVRESLAAGADVVTFSGDKMLGGPQAGIVVGRGAVVSALRRHPLARAVRIDKLDLAALDAVLRLYLDPRQALGRIPTLAALAEPLEQVDERARRLAESLEDAGEGVTVEVVPSVARAGAGALPVAEVPSAAVAIAAEGLAADELAERLRRGEPAVVARVHEDRLQFDARTLRDAELEEVVAAVLTALGG